MNFHATNPTPTPLNRKPMLVKGIHCGLFTQEQRHCQIFENKRNKPMKAMLTGLNLASEEKGQGRMSQAYLLRDTANRITAGKTLVFLHGVDLKRWLWDSAVRFGLAGNLSGAVLSDCP